MRPFSISTVLLECDKGLSINCCLTGWIRGAQCNHRIYGLSLCAGSGTTSSRVGCMPTRPLLVQLTNLWALRRCFLPVCSGVCNGEEAALCLRDAGGCGTGLKHR